MSVSIYAYRTLVWLSDQQQEVIPAGSVPAEILPADERDATHQEMLQHGSFAEHPAMSTAGENQPPGGWIGGRLVGASSSATGRLASSLHSRRV